MAGNGRPTHEKIIEKCWPAKCPIFFWKKKLKKLKIFTNFDFFQLKVFLAKTSANFLYLNNLFHPQCVYSAGDKVGNFEVLQFEKWL